MLKLQITTAVDDFLIFFFFNFSKKISLGYYVPQPTEGGHTDFGVDPVDVGIGVSPGVSVTLSCCTISF